MGFVKVILSAKGGQSRSYFLKHTTLFFKTNFILL